MRNFKIESVMFWDNDFEIANQKHNEWLRAKNADETIILQIISSNLVSSMIQDSFSKNTYIIYTAYSETKKPKSTGAIL